MSRIGKKPILVPSGVRVSVEGQTLRVVGPKGENQLSVHPDIAPIVEGETLRVLIARPSRRGDALSGLFRSLIANMVTGVTEGFEKKLELEGIGFRVNLDGVALAMQLGFSHPVRFEPPDGISFRVEKNVITVSGTDKGLVGETAARIRAKKPVEPYKGKGIRYQGEVVRRKSGKKTAAGGS